jgi:hypothetical protein
MIDQTFGSLGVSEIDHLLELAVTSSSRRHGNWRASEA